MMKKLVGIFVLCAAAIMACGPTDDGKTNEEICNDYGYNWDCIVFSTGQVKCQCNAFPDGGADAEPQAAAGEIC